MERRYLGATIAMAATFAVFSHAFGAGLLTKLQQPPTTLMSEMRCAAGTLRTELLDKVNRTLGGSSAEEAQLRVEFNLPAPVFAAPPVVAKMSQLKPPAAPVVACRAGRLSAEVKLPTNPAQIVQANVNQAMRTRMLVVQTQLQSREYQRAVTRAQREMARAATAQARAAVYQAKVTSGCPQRRSAHVASVEDTQDVDWDRMSREIEQEVSRSIDNSVRNF